MGSRLDSAAVEGNQWKTGELPVRIGVQLINNNMPNVSFLAVTFVVLYGANHGEN